MRTQAEIAAYYRQHRASDPFGFLRDALLRYLTADQVRPFFKPGADFSEWTAEPLTEAAVLTTMRDYMAFAWEKALGHRGISANRSVEKLGAWAWVLGRDDLADWAANDRHYAQYGVPVLKHLSESLGFPIPDDPRIARMAAGQACVPDCDNGCGT